MPRGHHPAGVLGDYVGWVGTVNNSPSNLTDISWDSTRANGALIQGQAPVGTSFKGLTQSNSISDGLSNTFLCGEKRVPQGMLGKLKVGDGSIYNGIWTTYSGRVAGPEDPLGTGPADATPSVQVTGSDAVYARKFGSWHTGVHQFTLYDGSVRAVRTSISTDNLRRYAVRNDGEVITGD